MRGHLEVPFNLGLCSIDYYCDEFLGNILVGRFIQFNYCLFNLIILYLLQLLFILFNYCLFFLIIVYFN